MNQIIASVLKKLDDSEIKDKKGQIICELAGISFYLDNRDILGGVIQSWFGEWMTSKNIAWKGPENSQTWPDFILNNNAHLEVKCFNNAESPGFDIANFTSYGDSLTEVPERLDDDYIVFGYHFDGANLSIANYWVKKVWELTGPSPLHFLNLQVKKNQPYNIRPKNWRGSGEIFSSRKDFVVAISKARKKFGIGNTSNWLQEVEKAYKQKTNQDL